MRRDRIAKAPVRGTKTGADLFNDLAEDKRFRPFLEDAANPWGSVKIAARSSRSGVNSMVFFQR